MCFLPCRMACIYCMTSMRAVLAVLLSAAGCRAAAGRALYFAAKGRAVRIANLCHRLVAMHRCLDVPAALLHMQTVGPVHGSLGPCLTGNPLVGERAPAYCVVAW